MMSCIGGSRFLVQGHAPAQRKNPLPPVVMEQGTTKLIIKEWGRPMKWGFSPGLASADEMVVRVEYKGGSPTSGTVSLRAVKPGITRVWYVNGFAQKHWPGKETRHAGDRDGFELKVLPPRCPQTALIPNP
jgi:hypothetical protein